jgi:hypothetical protein
LREVVKLHNSPKTVYEKADVFERYGLPIIKDLLRFSPLEIERRLKEKFGKIIAQKKRKSQEDQYYIDLLKKEYLVLISGSTDRDDYQTAALVYAELSEYIRSHNPPGKIYLEKAPIFKKYSLPIIPRLLGYSNSRLEKVLAEKKALRESQEKNKELEIAPVFKKHGLPQGRSNRIKTQNKDRLKQQALNLFRALGINEIPANFVLIPSNIRLLKLCPYYGIPLYKGALSYIISQRETLLLRALPPVKFTLLILRALGFDAQERKFFLDNHSGQLVSRYSRLMRMAYALLKDDYIYRKIKFNKDDFAHLITHTYGFNFVNELTNVIKNSGQENVSREDRDILRFLIKLYLDYFRGVISPEEMESQIASVDENKVIDHELKEEIITTKRIVELLKSKRDILIKPTKHEKEGYLPKGYTEIIKKRKRCLLLLHL